MRPKHASQKPVDFPRTFWYDNVYDYKGRPVISRSQEQTIEYARKFAEKLKGGEVIGLIGELGSGKTTFVKGLAEGLGIKESITSPTFVMSKEYNILRPKDHLRNGRNMVKTMVHVDAYRVKGSEDIKSVGIEDYFERSEKQGSAKAGSYLDRNDAVIIIEWAEKIKKDLPKNTIYIYFQHIDKNNRKISIKRP